MDSLNIVRLVNFTGGADAKQRTGPLIRATASRYAVAAVLGFSAGVAALPSSADELTLRDLAKAQQAQIGKIQREIQELRTESDLLKDLLKNVIASQGVQHEVARFSTTVPKELKQEISSEIPKVDQAMKAVSDLPAGSIDDGLKQRILKCITDAKTAAESDLDKGVKMVSSCAPSKSQGILKQLNQAKYDSVQAWKACRTTLEDAGQLDTLALPDDPTGLSVESIKRTQKQLQALQDALKNKAGEARDCADKLGKTFQDVQSQETASAALGQALSMAANICAASGGNPYVCGGMLLVAILMDLFGDKGQGGGGNGDGSGPDEGSGVAGKNSGGGVQTASQGGGDCKGSPADCQNGQPQQPIGGNFGPHSNGQLACDAQDGKLSCWLVSRPQVKIIVDPARAALAGTEAEKELTAVIIGKDSSKTLFCTANSGNFLKGILLTSSQAGKSYQIRADYGSSGQEPLSLQYSREAIETPAGDLGSACANSFK